MTISSPRAAPARWCTNPSSPAMVFSVLGSLITTISAPCWLPALPDQRPTSRMSRSASSGTAVFLNSRTARRLRRKSVRLCAVSVSAILLPRVGPVRVSLPRPSWPEHGGLGRRPYLGHGLGQRTDRLVDLFGLNQNGRQEADCGWPGR